VIVWDRDSYEQGGRSLALLAMLATALSAAIAPASLGSRERAIGADAWSPRLAAARRYAERRGGDVAFAVIDERSLFHGFRAARTAPAASVFKVMLLVAYLRERHDRPLSGGDRALLGPMIRRSDSVAATRVRDIVGRRRVERVARISGMRDFRYAAVWGESRTSPRDQARFMYRLRSLVPGSHWSYARFLLSHVVGPQRWGVGRVPHPGWALYFKGGWGSGSGRVDHQVALLERRHSHVAIAVFTQFDPDHRYGKRTLHGVFARLLSGIGSRRERPLRSSVQAVSG
jgi:hypothetical protein